MVVILVNKSFIYVSMYMYVYLPICECFSLSLSFSLPLSLSLSLSLSDHAQPVTPARQQAVRHPAAVVLASLALFHHKDPLLRWGDVAIRTGGQNLRDDLYPAVVVVLVLVVVVEVVGGWFLEGESSVTHQGRVEARHRPLEVVLVGSGLGLGLEGEKVRR